MPTIRSEQIRDATITESDLAASLYPNAVVSSNLGDAADIGSSGRFARQDHRHAREVSGLMAVMSRKGALVVEVGTGRWRWPIAVVLLGVSVALSQAPTTQPTIFDINVNGATVFTTQANRPTVAAGAMDSGAEAVPDITSVSAGGIATVDIDQIGGGTTAALITNVFIRYRPV